MKRLFRLFGAHPFLVLVLTLCSGLFFVSHVGKLGIDASSKTILLDDDPDLAFASQMAQRYGGGDFLVVAFTPKGELLGEQSLNAIEILSNEFNSLSHVSSTLSILNIPFILSPPKPLTELLSHIPTLKEVDKELAKNELLTSPIYKNNLVSGDFKTTALLLNLAPRVEDGATQREIEHQNIKDVREILSRYENQGALFLGGVNMIADDMISYVKSDILFYGVALFVLIFVSLYLIFRQLRYVLTPLFIAFFGAFVTSGLYGFLGWDITVISSNYIALQLIICISVVLHLMVRYKELLLKFPKVSQKKLVFATLYSKFIPSFFAILTTVVGFTSLLFSNIKPIIYLGLMMSCAITISLVLSFLLFGAIFSLLPKKAPHVGFEKSFALTSWCYELVGKKSFTIPFVVIACTVVAIWGSSKLEVENSFIDYFKKSTPIYQGMAIIDQKLGGTTPLDIIIDFKELQNDEEDDEFADEFSSTEAHYWFTHQKTDLITRVHDYLESQKEIGNVQSLATLLKVGEMLNKKELTSFELSLIYSELPPEFASVLLSPYLSIEHDQARISTRVIDSQDGLKRDELLKRINTDLAQIIQADEAEFRVSNLMVMYNNLLQMLFYSQIVTIGIAVLALLVMFWFIFGSFSVALIALASNLVPMGLIFGVMGLLGIRLDVMSITIAAISIGIGVDDTIHYLHRYKEELLHTKDYMRAVENSHQSIGYAMYYTSFIIMLGFSVLMVSNFMPTIYFGLLTFLVMGFVLLGSLVLLPYLLTRIKPRF